MEKPILPHEIKKVYDGRVFSVTVETITLPKGQQLKAEIVRHSPSVVILPITAEGDVVPVGARASWDDTEPPPGGRTVGLRVALGAKPGDIVRLIVGEGAALAVRGGWAKGMTIEELWRNALTVGQVLTTIVRSGCSITIQQRQLYRRVTRRRGPRRHRRQRGGRTDHGKHAREVIFLRCHRDVS